MNIQNMVKKNGGAMTLNLSHAEEYDYLLREYGGAGALKAFPELQRVLEDTKAAHERGVEDDYRTLLSKKYEPINGLCDAVYIAYAYYDISSKTLYYCGVVSLVKNASVCNVQIDVFDANQKQIAKEYQSYKNTGYIVLKGSEKLEPSTFVNKMFDVTMRVSMLRSQKNTLDVVVSSRTFYIDEILSEIDICHPIKKVQADDTINVFYGRFPGAYDKRIDYIYKEAYFENRNCAEMMLDMMGSAQFTEGSTAFTEAVTEECDVIMDFKRGAFYYNHKDGMMVEKQDDSGFGWYFDNDWGGTIPKSSFQASNRSALTMVLRYKTKATKDAVNTLTMSSHVDSDLGTSCKQLREFDLKIGCLAEGTLVRMADGRGMPIQNIRMGDWIMLDESCRFAMVRNIWRGMEGTMIVIETVNGHSVTVSSTHPVETDEGLIEAAKINAGMKVMTEFDGLVPIRFLYEIPYGKMVYNLELEVEEGKGRMFANQIKVGDVFAEVTAQRKGRETLSDNNAELAEKLFEEFRRLNLL